MKYVILVPDGMADHPLESLKGMTPVEAADTPNMDHLVMHGVCGMAKTFYEGLPYDSSIANMGILGYDPKKYFFGRSPLEAANIGVSLREGDISLRCNLITVEDGRIKDFTAGHITSQESKTIMEDLGREFGRDDIEFYPGVSYRNLLVLRQGLNPRLGFRAYQPHDIVGRETEKHSITTTHPEARHTVELLNELTEKSLDFLKEHPVNEKRVNEGKNPANSIWLWGAGQKPVMPSFENMHDMRGSLVSAVDLLNGLAKIVGMKVLEVEGVTGYLDTNYEGKADAAVESLKDVDLTYVHVEATDEAGHEGIVENKIKAIEDVDSKVLGRIMDKIGEEYRLLMLPDHPTPVEIKTHTNEPVPFVVYDSAESMEKSSMKAYSEKDILKNGSLPLTDAYSLIDLMKRV